MEQISVLIPVHGHAPYLEESLRSVAIQQGIDLSKLEVLLILDRSTVDIDFLLNKFADLKILAIKSEKPGLVSALNLGLNSSSSDLIARLDSDDTMSPYRLSKQFLFMNENPEIGLVASYTAVTDEYSIINRISLEPISHNEIAESLSYRCCIAHPSVMFRKNIVIEAGGYREFYQHAEDYDLWLRIISKTKFHTIPEFLTYYRTHQGQVSIMHYKQQQISTAAAQFSMRLRSKNRPELDELHKDAQSWQKSLRFRNLLLGLTDKSSVKKRMLFKIALKLNFSTKTIIKELINKAKNV